MRTTKSSRWLMAGVALVLASLPTLAGAQAQANNDPLRMILGSGIKSPVLSQADADQALRQALTIGSQNVTTRLGALDGFWKDNRVKIPLPGQLGKAQKQLKKLGLSAPLDDLQLKINRGAEATMPKAKELFLSTIKSMTLQDAIAIVRGGPTAGTDFLKSKLGASLKSALMPQIETSLQGSGALAALDSTAAKYGGSAYAQSARTKLVDFAAERAIEGVFSYLADEEKAIRADPARRTTDLLRKVFGL